MSGGSDCETAGTGDSDDMAKFVDSLSDLKLQETDLDVQATAELTERCLAKFDDVTAPLDSRAIALYTIVAQITSGNARMFAHVPHICQRLRSPSVLEQPLSSVDALDFHREVINAISVMLDYAADRLVNESFPPLMSYLARLVGSDDVHLAIMACEFWARYVMLPVDTPVRREWLKAFLPELPTLILGLMDQMMYRPAHSEYLEQVASRCSNPDDDTLLPDAIRLFSHLRNLAAMAFERIANFYPADHICTTFRPLLEQRITSNSWREKEAAIMALAAFTEGTGLVDAMRDSYAVIVPRVMDCYSDAHPLVRSIACFTMPKLVGHRLRGAKDPWSRVLTCTAKSMRDSCAEVRSIATRGLATLLAFGTAIASAPGEPVIRIDGHTSRLVDALVRARECDMDPETRSAHFECVSHLVGRATDSLSSAEVDRLLPPLIDAWMALPWDRAIDGETTPTANDPCGVVPLTVHLVNIAIHGKSLYAPYAELLVQKACADIEEIVKSAAAKNNQGAESETGLSSAMTSHIICCLDLVKANFEGLGQAAAQYSVQFQLLPRLYATLTGQSFDSRVYQSAFGLLGHVLRYEAGQTEPAVDAFLDLIHDALDAVNTSRKTCGNALWALSHAVVNPTASDHLVLAFVERLITAFERTEDEPTCIIFAALTLTSICAARAADSASHDIVTRPDVLLHLSGLLSAQFPRPSEKHDIFTNVCSMLTPAVKKVPADMWPVFLAAVVADDEVTIPAAIGRNDLYVSLRSLLRDVRSTLGSAGWTHVLQELGTQPATVLRRRYKLF